MSPGSSFRSTPTFSFGDLYSIGEHITHFWRQWYLCNKQVSGTLSPLAEKPLSTPQATHCRIVVFWPALPFLQMRWVFQSCERRVAIDNK